jgi:hypothetical protein
MSGFFTGWHDAEKAFAPSHSYLHDEDDKVADWLYRARALIGVAILVVVSVHYHHPTRNIIALFTPVLGGVTKPMILALLGVAPATVAVVLFTRPSKRTEAFRQMIRYPVKVLLICLVAYMCIVGLAHGLVRMADTDNILIEFAVLGIMAVAGILCLRWLLFIFRSIYLITVKMCRLGDGHPLLPPVAGTIIAWVVGAQSLSGGGYISPGEPAIISITVLLGGPLSITALAIAEVLRLRTKYPNDFPFRNGPLPLIPERQQTERTAGSERNGSAPPHRHFDPYSI